MERPGRQQSQNPYRLEHFLWQLGQPPQRIERQLQNPERENAKLRQPQQPRPRLLMDQLYWSDETS